METRKNIIAITLCIAVLGMLFSAGMAQAESPVIVTHTLTNSSDGGDSVTLSFMLHVENPGSTPLYNLTLSHVPLSIFALDEISLRLDNLEAGASLDIPFNLVTPMHLSRMTFSEQPLFWAGECLDGTGYKLEFPVKSNPVWEGGAL